MPRLKNHDDIKIKQLIRLIMKILETTKIKASVVLACAMSLGGCGATFLATLNEIPKNQYAEEFDNTSDQMIATMKTSGTIESDKKGVVLQAVALRVAHQNKLPNKSGNTLAEHESSWGSGNNSKYGFLGASNVARDIVKKHLINVRGFESVYTFNKAGMELVTDKVDSLKFPIDLPEEDLDPQWEHMRTATVTSYKRPTVDYNITSTVSQTGVSPNIFPYFTLSLKKTGAGLTKLNDELVINYIAKIKGHVVVCMQGKCESADAGTVDFTMRLIIHKHFTDVEVYKELDSHFQHELAGILGRYTIAAVDQILMKTSH